MKSSLERLKTLLAWIDSVPRDAVLPAMPGFDRDDVNALIEQNELADASAVAQAIEMASEWIACVPQIVKLQLPEAPAQTEEKA